MIKSFIKKIPFSEKTYRFLKRITGENQFKRDFRKFRSAVTKTGDKRFSLRWTDRYPCLEEKTPEVQFDQHYVYHTAWAARILAKNPKQEHVDISSSLFFSSIVSAFVPIHYYDYRKVELNLSNLSCGEISLLSLPFKDNSIPSLSCMHVIEHVGLGRYGDPIDPRGDLRAISELKRVVSMGGNLLFVVPIGKPKIMFNAHRIYSYSQIISYFLDFELLDFSLVPDSRNSKLISNATKELADAQQYGCGCFLWRKPRD